MTKEYNKSKNKASNLNRVAFFVVTTRVQELLETPNKSLTNGIVY